MNLPSEIIESEYEWQNSSSTEVVQGAGNQPYFIVNVIECLEHAIQERDYSQIPFFEEYCCGMIEEIIRIETERNEAQKEIERLEDWVNDLIDDISEKNVQQDDMVTAFHNLRNNLEQDQNLSIPNKENQPPCNSCGAQRVILKRFQFEFLRALRGESKETFSH